MLLTCPACDTQYKVDEAALDPSGSKVRCFRCSYTWMAKPPDSKSPDPKPEVKESGQESMTLDESQEKAPDEAESAAAATEPAAASEAVARKETKAPAPKKETKGEEPSKEEVKEPAAPTPPPTGLKAEKPKAADKREADRKAEILDRGKVSSLKSKRQVPVWPFYAAVLLLAGSLIVVLYIGRAQLSRVHPLSAELYRAFGYEVVLPGDGLAIESIKSVKRALATSNELEVAGEVVNVSDQPRMMPGLKVIILDSEGKELSSWTETLREKALMPKERALFNFSMTDPPSSAVNVEIEFVPHPGGEP